MYFKKLSYIYIQYSALLHLPPLRFHSADGCWDRTQDRCNLCIGSQTLYFKKLSLCLPYLAIYAHAIKCYFISNNLNVVVRVRTLSKYALASVQRLFFFLGQNSKKWDKTQCFFLAKSKQQALQYTALYMPTVGVIVILI